MGLVQQSGHKEGGFHLASEDLSRGSWRSLIGFRRCSDIVGGHMQGIVGSFT